MRQFTIDECMRFIIERHFAYPSAPITITSDTEALKHVLYRSKPPIIIRACFNDANINTKNDTNKIKITTALLGAKVESDGTSRQYGVYINNEMIRRYINQFECILRKFYVSSSASKLDIVTYMKHSDFMYILNISTFLMEEEIWDYKAALINSHKGIEQQLKELKVDEMIINQMGAEWLIEDM